MDVGAGSAGKTLEEVICQLRLKVADEARAYFGIDHGHDWDPQPVGFRHCYFFFFGIDDP